MDEEKRGAQKKEGMRRASTHKVSGVQKQLFQLNVKKYCPCQEKGRLSCAGCLKKTCEAVPKAGVSLDP